MKKLFLLVALVCAGQMYGMESAYQYCANIIPHTYSYITSLFTKPESQLLQALRKDRDDFEEKLTITAHMKDENLYNAIIAVALKTIPEEFITTHLASPLTYKPIIFFSLLLLLKIR